MKKITFILLGTAMLATACKQEPQHVSPVDKFLGTFHMDCTCDDMSTVPTESIQDTFTMHITGIPNDTAHLILGNVHNLGINDTVDIIGETTFNNDFNYSTGTIYPPDSVFLYYLRGNMNCGGYGAK